MCESPNCTCELSLAGFPHTGAAFYRERKDGEARHGIAMSSWPNETALLHASCAVIASMRWPDIRSSSLTRNGQCDTTLMPIL